MNRLSKMLLLPFMVISLNVNATDFSTEETVRFALSCMADNGGLSDENLYYCTCRLDHMATHISFSDYEEGVTFERNKAMAGEKGGFFRDNERGRGMYEKLKEARKAADSECILVKKVTR
jgi:hypothetical protein